MASATLTFATGAIGSVTSTSLLGWHHKLGLHLVGEGIALELTDTELVVHSGGPPERSDAGPDEAKRRVDRDFIDAVAGRADRVRAPYAEALRTHRLACAIADSAVLGLPLPLGADGRTTPATATPAITEVEPDPTRATGPGA